MKTLITYLGVPAILVFMFVGLDSGLPPELVFIVSLGLIGVWAYLSLKEWK